MYFFDGYIFKLKKDRYHSWTYLSNGNSDGDYCITKRL